VWTQSQFGDWTANAKHVEDFACYSWIVLSSLDCQINETAMDQEKYDFLIVDEVISEVFTFQFQIRRK
jgi:hypothetical protein